MGFKKDFELISEPIDFYGQNIYNGYIVEGDENDKARVVPRKSGSDEGKWRWLVDYEKCIAKNSSLVFFKKIETKGT